MKITSILRKVILENSRFNVLFDKLVKPSEKSKEGLLSFETLKAIIFADPTTAIPEGLGDIDELTVEDMDKVKVGKYTQWLIKNFVSPKASDFEFEGERDSKNPSYKKAKKRFEELFMEDLFKQTERLQFYEKVKQYLPQEQRDINKLGIRDLFQIFSTFELPEKKKKEQEKKLAKKTREGFKHAGGEILFEGDKWVLIKISDKGPTGKDAAIYYGGYKDFKNGESDWCTSAPGLSYFDGYIKKGPLYVIFPQDDKGEVGKRTGLPKERYQFHFQDSQFMDREDHQINLVDMLNGPMEELKPYFKQEFAKGLVSASSNKVNIEYPRDSGGKFIALYGMTELFNTLPDDILNLTIKNNSQENFSHPIPDSISRFKNLKIIMLQNCISSVPSSISECQSLTMISLPNNKELKTVPESIANLQNLSFFNVKGCSQELVSGNGIPKKLREKLSDEGNTESEKGFFYIMPD